MVKIQGMVIEEQAEKALKTCLQRVPFLVLEDIVWESRDGLCEKISDFVATIRVGQKHLRIIAEVKNNGQPRVVRSVIPLLRRYCESSTDNYCVFIAPYISSQSADICLNEGVGYLDLAGNCRLTFGEVYIEQKGNPNPYSQKRDLRSLYSPKAERIIRVFLNNPETFWRFKPLAAEAVVSLGQISNVKTLLEDREWLMTSDNGFRVREPESLLEEWTKNYNFKRNIARNYYTLKTPAEIENDLAEVCDRINVRYALTGYSGAMRYAPMVRYQRAMAYVANRLDIITSKLSLKEVTSGANVTLFEPYDEGVFYGIQVINGVQVVSPVQLYLDLMNMKGRGEEAASAVLTKVIKRTW